MSVTYPDRVRLARLPTPLDPLERTSAELGVELWIKRDDLTGAELSGNKVRKLEFLLADARAAGADTVITCGGEQSNHCRATALAAARLGMRSQVLLRTVDPSSPPPVTGNILLDRLAGSEVVWISHADYARRAELLVREAERARAAGRTPYVIPEGGSNAVGAWGYVLCAEELREAIAALPPKPTTIISACGSGGTSAGLALGAHIFDLPSLDARIACVNVCDDRAYFTTVIDRITAEFIERYQLGDGAGADDVDIVDGYVGRGYAKTRPEELTVLRDLARTEGIVLDPVYSGKAFFGLTRELAADKRRFGERVIFIHTGGIFGLLAKAAEVEAAL